MNLQKVLGPRLVSLDLKGASKDEVIEELLALIFATGKVSDEAAARAAVFDREKKMSTGMQNGVAIPHGKTDAVDSLLACIGVHREGVDFESLDGQPSHIFVMTVSPASRSGPHIQFLATVSQLLKHQSGRQAVMDARSPEELIQSLAGKS